MAERPDLEYLVPILSRELTGRSIISMLVLDPVILRMALPDRLEDLLRGATIQGAWRRSHYIMFPVKGPRPLEIAWAPMLGGKFSLEPKEKPRTLDLAIAVGLDDGRLLRYRDHMHMGKMYILDRGRWSGIAELEKVGVDVLDPAAFTREAFRAIAGKRREQVKVFLLDKSALDFMGNAYGDEVLWEARIHPKRIVKNLSVEELDRLHDAIVKVLSEARAEVARRAPPMDEKVRDFLKVRLRHLLPCPRCGEKIRKAGVYGHDAYICPACQPDERKGALVGVQRDEDDEDEDQ